ncbi:hypothetical protein [Thalassiella azotivora]
MDDTTAGNALLADVRRRRVELLEAITTLERALAAPAGPRTGDWAQRVHVALVELAGDLREHVRLNEAPDGLFADVVRQAPRLAGAVRRLCAEHERIGRTVTEVLGHADRLVDDEAPGQDAVDTLRGEATTLLGLLVRHRQHGSDLVFEAYATDIGGET